MSKVVYLYGVVPGDAPDPPAALAGVGDAPVAVLRLDGAAAVVSFLPGAEYAAAAVETRLQDLAWVGEQGVAHERVVLWFVDHADILPARLLSLYADEAALRTSLAGQSAHLHGALRRLRGRREWNLKVAYDAAMLEPHAGEFSPDVARIDRELADAPPGRRYLLQRQRTEAARSGLAAAARTGAERVLARLAPLADASRTLPLADADSAGTVVLNAALLVRREAEPELRAAAEQLASAEAGHGIILSFTGPWAPYRFMEPDADAR